jgi:copper chaperone NosL
MFKYKSTLFLILLYLFASCSNKPEPIDYGTDECEFCRMLITDNRYGAEMVTDKGKIFKFDSIECLVNFSLAKNLIGDQNQILLVTDFANSPKFIQCKNAYYIQNENFRSPMGLNVSAFGNQDSVKKFLADNGGTEIPWLEVIELVKQSSM